MDLEFVDKGATMPGALQKFQVDKKTIEHLQQLMKDGKAIEVDAQGTIKVSK